MAYISLYRKYRSQSFDDVMGQDHVTRTLQNAIKSGKIGHAYLFCGSRGTGKTTVARLLAKAVNCEHGPTPTPCNECDACLSIAEGSAVDVVELDAASHRSVEDVDALRDGVKYPPMRLRYRVYVIDEAHQLSSTAKDAFLKTLEEPPPHAIFVLATTEAHEIPMTIRSRCQQFDFRRGSVGDIKERLRYVVESEGREADAAALEILGRGAQGSWRDALSLLEQVLSYTGDRLTAEDVNTVLGTVDEDVLFEVSDIIGRDDAAAAFELAGRLVHEGKDVRELLKAIAGHFRDLLAASVGAGSEAGVRVQERARQFTRERLVSLVELFASAEREMRWSEQHRLALEIAFLKAVTAPAPAAVQAHRAPVDDAPEVRTPAPRAPQPQPAHSSAPARPPAARPAQPPKLEQSPVAASDNEPMETMPDGEVSVTRVQAVWGRVLNHIKDVQRKPLLIGVLREAELLAVEGGVLHLGYDDRYSFHVQKVQQSENIETIKRAIEAVLGKRLGVKAFVNEQQSLGFVDTADVLPVNEEPADTGAPPAPAGDGGDGGMVQDVLQMFGGKVVEDIEDEKYDPWKES